MSRANLKFKKMFATVALKIFLTMQFRQKTVTETSCSSITYIFERNMVGHLSYELRHQTYKLSKIRQEYCTSMLYYQLPIIINSTIMLFLFCSDQFFQYNIETDFNECY